MRRAGAGAAFFALGIRNIVARALTAGLLVLVSVLAAQAQTTVTATWDRSADSVTAGYRIYYGTTSGSYQWSQDVGNQTSAPLTLSTGSTYYFTVRGYNASYQYGPASAEATINLTTSTPAPTPTTAPTARIQASMQSSTSALVSWQTTNAVSATINGATVATSGSQTVTVSANTTFTLVATSSSGARATASASVTVSTTGSTLAPPAPTNMTASVSGSRATLSWRPGTGGSPATEYLVYVSTTSWGQDVLYALNVGNVLTASGDLPLGSYYARVRARNRVTTSASSNQARFIIGRQLASPSNFRLTWQGSTATLTWTPAAFDALEDAPSNYILEVGNGPGLDDVATMPVGNVTSFSTEVPAGTYYVRVRSVNQYGGSHPTADIAVVAPGAPAAPTGLSDAGSGSTVDLGWTAPAGPTPTGYIIEAGSESGLSDLAKLEVSTPRFTTEVPAGIYYVRVRAVNENGAGPVSSEIVVRK